MTTHARTLAVAIALGFLSASLACGPPEPAAKSAETKKEPKKKGSGGENDDDGDPVKGEDEPVTPPAAPAAAALVYAHTSDTLYTFESAERKLTEVGKFSCLPEGDRVLDIAVDGKGTIYGTSDLAFLAVNPKDASCTRIVAKRQLPNALSFVPAGTLDAAKDALVGYAFDANSRAVKYVRIDVVNGSMTEIGWLNPSSATSRYTSSGDIFSVESDGNKTYVTVRPDPDTGGADLLAEINPSTGAIKDIVGDTLQRNIYGLAYWAGKAYGFSDDGNVTEINVSTGVSNIVTTLRKDNIAVPWFGAGVTTKAPTKPRPGI